MIFAPSNHTAPLVGWYTPVMTLKAVVFPAVGSDEGHDLPLVDLQLQIVHSHNAAELHGDVIQSQKLLTHGCTASFFAFFCRFFRRSGSSLSPMMPFRKNSTTTMMMTENTTIRKPVRRKGTLKLPM